jgi:hypothetical protein
VKLVLPPELPAVGWVRATIKKDLGFALLGSRVAPVDVVVFDERYDEAVQFAAELERAGAVAFATGGECAPQWSTCPVFASGGKRLRVAGLTQHSHFEQLRSLCVAMGLRVLHEARHVRRESGAVRHSLSCVRNDVFVAACGSAQWPRQLARAMSDARRATTVTRSSLSVTPAPKSALSLTSCLLG